jgi:hypothetical protein
VLATDISANMLETAAISARQEGLSNVDTRVMDAQTLDLPSASVSCPDSPPFPRLHRRTQTIDELPPIG